MARRLILAFAALATMLALAGCIGTEDVNPDAQSVTNETPTDAEAAGVPAQAYALDDGELTTVDENEVLPDGVPTPTGLDRHIENDKQSVFEPTIGVTSEGNLFISNLAGSAATDYSSILRSTDQGQTWEDVTGSIGPVSSPPQSNDPYVYVDEETDRVYNLDMQGLQGNYIRWSDDEGETWTARPQAGETPVLDHPTLFAGDPNMVETVGYENLLYLCVNRVGDASCATSTDGGLSWSPFKTVYPGADQGVASTGSGFCGGLHAHGTVGPEGTAYLPKGHCGVPSVAISQDDGLTWEIVAISEEVGAGDHEVAIATDDGGNVYAHWFDDDHEPYFAYSTDEGQTWSDAIAIAPPEVSLMDFPTIAATGNGSVALAYVGTTADVDSFEDLETGDPWNGYLTTITNATSEDPTILTTTVNPEDDPIARGNCNSANRCQGDSGGYLGDFIDVVIDDGRPWVALVDTCTEECVDNPSSGRDVGVGMVGTINQGPSLSDPTTALSPLVNATGTK